MRTEEAKKILASAVEEIKSLMRQEKWRDAHRACLEILRFDPENIKIIRLKSKIEKAVKKLNRNAIETDLRNLEPLWKEKKYEELLAHLKTLESYASDVPKISGLILKANKEYQKQLLGHQEQYLRQEINEINALASDGKYAEAVKSAVKLLALKLDEQKVRGILAGLRSEWIDYELKQTKPLKNFEDTLLFYQGLLHIDDKSKKVKRLIEITKKTYQVFRIQEQRELIYKQFEKIRTLYQMGRYELVVELSDEILGIDPENKNAKFYLAKATAKAEKALDKEILAQMKTSRKQLKAGMKQSRKDYTII